MYWNRCKLCNIFVVLIDKLQHEMYWNFLVTSVQDKPNAINYNMRCIEMTLKVMMWHQRLKINYNMRCIEIDIFKRAFPVKFDKLQHEMYWNKEKGLCYNNTVEINYNMRCIEIWEKVTLSHDFSQDKLQHEMYWNFVSHSKRLFSYVDKLQHEMYWNITASSKSCAIASDKLQHEMYWNRKKKTDFRRIGGINYNMRCIEIAHDRRLSDPKSKINYNMRCIEIRFHLCFCNRLFG